MRLQTSLLRPASASDESYIDGRPLFPLKIPPTALTASPCGGVVESHGETDSAAHPCPRPRPSFKIRCLRRQRVLGRAERRQKQGMCGSSKWRKETKRHQGSKHNVAKPARRLYTIGPPLFHSATLEGRAPEYGRGRAPWGVGLTSLPPPSAAPHTPTTSKGCGALPALRCVRRRGEANPSPPPQGGLNAPRIDCVGRFRNSVYSFVIGGTGLGCSRWYVLFYVFITAAQVKIRAQDNQHAAPSCVVF